MSQAVPIRKIRMIPIQNELKLPAVRPERILSDEPPSREDVTTSRTWADSAELNTLTNSRITSPASVPHVMIEESFHQSVSFPPKCGIMNLDTRKVSAIERIDVIQTRFVSGFS